MRKLAKRYYYISTCPDTKRVFVCKSGKDGNLCEAFTFGSYSAKQIGRRISVALNRGGEHK